MSLRSSNMASARSARPSMSRRAQTVVCSAQVDFKQAAAAAALATVVGFSAVEPAQADIAGLTPCKDSKAFAKRNKQTVKKLTQRKKQYEAGSAPALALDATIERTNARFASYGKAGLLCGADGLPHLIADPGLALRFGHAGEIFIPTFGFLYIAGWIGYVGRMYLMATKAGAGKATDKEIIIDVPLALDCASKGAAWPLQVVSELRNDTLTEKEANITVSPR